MAPLSAPPPSERRAPERRAPGGRLQGELQLRGPGVIGKWERCHLLLDGGTLSLSAPADSQSPRVIRLADVTGLSLNETRRECSFAAKGGPVRLRSEQLQTVRTWHAALADSVSKLSQMQQMPQTLRIPDAAQPADAGWGMDVLVQIDTLFGLPASQEGQQQGLAPRYAVRAGWAGRAAEPGAQTEERPSRRAPSGSGDECVVHQQLRLPGAPGCRAVVVTVLQRPPGTSQAGRPVAFCTLDAGAKENLVLGARSFVDASGHPLDLSARLGLAVKPRAEGSPAPSARSPPGGPTAALAEEAEAPAARRAPEASEGRAAQRPSLAGASPPGRAGLGAALKRASPPSVRATSPPRGASPPPRGASSPPRGPGPLPTAPEGLAAAAPARSPLERSVSHAEVTDRLHDPLGSPRQRREARARSPEKKVQVTCMPPACADRLYGEALQRRERREQQAKHAERLEEEKLERHRVGQRVGMNRGFTKALELRGRPKGGFGVPPAKPKAADDPQSPDSAGAPRIAGTWRHSDGRAISIRQDGETLHVEDEQTGREPVEVPAADFSAGDGPCSFGGQTGARVGDEIAWPDGTRWTREPGEAAPPPKEEALHDKLYQDGELKRQKLKEQQERALEAQRSMLKFGKSRKEGPDLKFVENLHNRHWDIKQKKEQAQKEKEKIDALKLEEEQRPWSQRKGGAGGGPTKAPRRQCVAVLFDVPGFTGDALTDPQRGAAVEEFKAAVAQALASSTCRALERVEVDLSSGAAPGGDSGRSPGDCTVQARLLLPMGSRDAEAVASDVRGEERLPSLVSELLGRALGTAEAPRVAAASVRVRAVETRRGPSPEAVTHAGVVGRVSLFSPCQRSAYGRRDVEDSPWAAALKARDSADHGSEAAGAQRPTAQEDVLVGLVFQAVQARFGSGAAVGVQRRQKLAEPLREALAVFRASDAASRRHVDYHYQQLCSAPSQRLYQERLHTDDEIFELCVAPDPVRQVESDLERLLPAAELAQQMLLDALLGGEPPDGHAEWPIGLISQKPAAAPLALGVYNPGAKERGAAERKQLARYAPGEGRGCCWSLLDLARVSLVFPSYRALQSSLDAFLTSGEFDVVLVRNFFRTPSRLGARHVDVYVAFPVPGEGGSDPTLHICEVRFEEQSWMKARLEGAAPHVDSFFDAFRRTLVTLPGVADLELASHLAQDVLTSQPETGMLKHFRRSLARQQLGSSVAIWRDVVPGRRLDFSAFRDICRALGEKKEHMTALWTEMDPGFAGCVSLFDFDAEAAASLKRFRDRVLTLGGGEEEPGAPAAPTGARDRLDAVLRGIHALVQPRARGQLGRFEFQRLAQSLGILAPEAARILACLDRCRMDQRGQGQVFVRDADIGWLLSLDRLVDLGAACLEDHRRPAGEASGPWDASDSPQQQGWNFSEEVVDPSALARRASQGSEGDSEPMEPEGEETPGLQGEPPSRRASAAP